VSQEHLVTNTLEFPYQRSLGPVIGAFMDGLADRRLLGARTQTGRVIVPPLEYDPDTGGATEAELVEVGPDGVVTTWTWVPEPLDTHPLPGPFAFALVALDGADTGLTHVVDTGGDPARMQTGMRVRPRWRSERAGRIDDIEAFEPSDKS
jgi:uncharacterized protein